MKSFWENQFVLVTGGSGFLGSWTIEALLKRGANVCAIGRNPRFLRLRPYASLSEATWFYSDLNEPAVLRKIFRSHPIRIVFHLAANAVTDQAAVSVFETNARGTWNLLQAAAECGSVRRVIVASSDRVYAGTDEEVFLSETAPLIGDDPYGVSKQLTERLAQYYGQRFGISTACVRFSPIYGGGDLHWKRLIPGIVRSLLSGNDAVLRSSGEQKRSFLHVEDAVEAMLRLCEQERVGKKSEVFNLGNPHGISVREVAETAAHMLYGKETPVEREARKREKHVILSSEKLYRTLAWKPGTDLKTGLQKTLDWYRQYTVN